jgi:hypothetical protein
MMLVTPMAENHDKDDDEDYADGLSNFSTVDDEYSFDTLTIGYQSKAFVHLQASHRRASTPCLVCIYDQPPHRKPKSKSLGCNNL